MTCLEAQSNIMAFIEKKLPDDKVTEFVRHMRYCPNCSEELEIYYTLIVGIRQVDNNEELSQDFKKDLNNELNRIENKVKTVKRFKLSTFGVFLIAAVFAVLVFYNACLNKVYNIEQRMKKQAQGETFFYDNFADYINMCGDDIVIMNAHEEKPREITFYERVHDYNLAHSYINDNIEKELDKITDN